MIKKTINEIPFEELFIIYRRFSISFPNEFNQLSSFQEELSYSPSLGKQLLMLYSRVLKDYYNTFFSKKGAAYFLLQMTMKSKLDNKTEYSQFITYMHNTGLINLHQKCSLIEQIKNEIITNYNRYFKLLLIHLNTDLISIQNTFNNGKKTGSVINIETGSGDVHNHGKSVAIISFSTGFKIVYKPRSLSVDCAFYNLIGWINNHEEPRIKLKQLKILDKDDYGWMEYAFYNTCKNIEEVKSYYTRSGMLLALVYLLRGSDFHLENIIASGQDPVLIDLECLLSPSLNRNDSRNLKEEFTVLNTDLLPTSIRTKKIENVIDFSGFSAETGKKTGKKITAWHNVNTDGMYFGLKDEKLPEAQNIPVFNNKYQRPEKYFEEICQGFRAIGKLLLKEKNYLLSKTSVLQQFGNTDVRVIFRGTQSYVNMLIKLSDEKYLSNQDIRNAKIEKLLTSNNEEDCQIPEKYFNEVCQLEKDALNRQDVPLFYTNTSKKSIFADNTELKNCFKNTCFEQLIDDVSKLSIEKIEKQVKLIVDTIN